jgi:hypothetical protein
MSLKLDPAYFINSNGDTVQNFDNNKSTVFTVGNILTKTNQLSLIRDIGVLNKAISGNIYANGEGSQIKGVNNNNIFGKTGQTKMDLSFRSDSNNIFSYYAVPPVVY